MNLGKFAIVDDDDYEYLSQWNWFLSSAGYASRNERYGKGRRRSVFMHRVVAKTPPGMCTDHINSDPLDNRKENLRICTKGQNNFKRRYFGKKADTPYRGVYLRYGTRYHSWLKIKGKRIFLGTYGDAVSAAKAYNEAARKHFGEFAILNDIAA